MMGPPPNGVNPLHCGAVVASTRLRHWPGSGPTRFNPLHCGAVVASSRRCSARRRRRMVSIPFIAGQWSLLLNAPRRTAGGQGVSIPFIAGQWSLQDLTATEDKSEAGFNPLHCGAVVASAT